MSALTNITRRSEATRVSVVHKAFERISSAAYKYSFHSTLGGKAPTTCVGCSHSGCIVGSREGAMAGLVKWTSVSIGVFMLYLTALVISNGTKQTTDTILPLLQ